MNDKGRLNGHRRVKARRKNETQKWNNQRPANKQHSNVEGHNHIAFSDEAYIGHASRHTDCLQMTGKRAK